VKNRAEQWGYPRLDAINLSFPSNPAAIGRIPSPRNRWWLPEDPSGGDHDPIRAVEKASY
jgi:hypothetical protein